MSVNMKDRLDVLAERNPWPSDCPRYPPFDWCLDGGGKELVKDIIQSKSIRLMLEIGVFFGGSVRRWLETSPYLTVIGIDPWVGDFSDYLAKRRKAFPDLDIATLKAQLKEPDAMYHSAMANLWSYRDRFIPVRGGAPEKVYELHELGIVPELIYLDWDKQGKYLDIYPKLFPDAVITGDDWTWGGDRGYPRQQSVRKFAKRHGYVVHASAMTWVLEKSTSSL